MFGFMCSKSGFKNSVRCFFLSFDPSLLRRVRTSDALAFGENLPSNVERPAASIGLCVQKIDIVVARSLSRGTNKDNPTLVLSDIGFLLSQ